MPTDAVTYDLLTVCTVYLEIFEIPINESIWRRTPLGDPYTALVPVP
jgi:hypothetical protein